MADCEPGPDWVRGKVFGQYYDPPFSYSVYPVWRPAVWHSACITASQASGLVTINMDGERVLEAEYSGENITENILLLNRARRPQPHHGSLTDLQAVFPLSLIGWILITVLICHHSYANKNKRKARNAPRFGFSVP